MARLVDEFWEAVLYGPQSFPRDLAYAASIALPVVTKELPGLSLSGVNGWLVARGIAESIEGLDRPLRGCLLAYGGHGFLLVDKDDSVDEKRFTTAHELAHFLLDYREPRRRAVEALGDGIVPVLDSVRPPTSTERLHAILSTVPLGLHVALMERTSVGGYTARATLDAEDRADRLALELLAPSADALNAISALAGSREVGHTERQQQAAQLLGSRYGLPEEQAQAYAKWLLKDTERKSGIRDWLGVNR